MPGGNNGYWSVGDRVERLKHMHADGLSCSIIAARLGGGVSRSGVIGKLHRLVKRGEITAVLFKTPRVRSPRKPRLMQQRRARVQRPVDALAPAPSPELFAAFEAASMADEPPPLPGPPRTLMSLGERDCRWPVGDPRHADFRFCARPK